MILPPGYGIDPNPVPAAVPAAGSWAELEALVVKFAEARAGQPDTLHCHPAVVSAISQPAPAPGFPAMAHEPLSGIRCVTDAGMPYGAWELLSGSEVVETGSIA